MLRTALLGFLLAVSLAPSARAAAVGQWVWSLRDVAPLQEARANAPNVASAIHIGTLRWDRGTRAFALQLGLSPVAVPGNTTIVVRLDDALHGAWRTQSPARIAVELNRSLAKLRDLVEPLGTGFTWQLDYDVPVSRLGVWSEVLGALRSPKGALAGQRLWVTSLISHVQAAAFEPVMRPVVDGHVLQIFDTGALLTTAQLAATRKALARTSLPFAIGVARDDAIQMDWIATLSRNSRFAGTWVFPAGKPWPAWTRSLL